MRLMLTLILACIVLVQTGCRQGSFLNKRYTHLKTVKPVTTVICFTGDQEKQITDQPDAGQNKTDEPLAVSNDGPTAPENNSVKAAEKSRTVVSEAPQSATVPLVNHRIRPSFGKDKKDPGLLFLMLDLFNGGIEGVLISLLISVLLTALILLMMG